MKKTLSIVALILAVIISLVSCGEEATSASLWDSATYTENTTVGEGAITFKVKIEAEGKTVTLTVNTDEKILGNALYELGLTNDPTFFNKINGMTLDWDKTHAYWGFYIGDTMADHGVGDEPIKGGEVYRIAYTK